MSSDIETYALLYCQYDSKSGSRRYDLLPYDTIVELDIAVAKTAVDKEPLSEVVKIIYFGSPNAQQLGNGRKRQQYALSIVGRINNYR